MDKGTGRDGKIGTGNHGKLRPSDKQRQLEGDGVVELEVPMFQKISKKWQ